MSDEIEKEWVEKNPGCCEVLITMDANNTIETKVLGSSKKPWHEIIGMMEIAKAAHLKRIINPEPMPESEESVNAAPE